MLLWVCPKYGDVIGELWLGAKRMELTEADRRLNVEAAVLDILAKYGGTVLVAGEKTYKIIQEITDEVMKLREDGII